MPTSRRIIVGTFVIVVALAGLLGLAPVGAEARRSTAERSQVERLRAHFDSVDVELRARDVSSLTTSQRAARARHIAVLRAYRDRGVFPRNTDFPTKRVPYFVDRSGTLCAMAHLIAMSGRRDIVDGVAATRNNAYIPELADDAALLAWLDSAGLSVAEAARIQPEYQHVPEPGEPEVRGNRGVRTPYATATALVAGINGASLALNLGRVPAGERAARGWFGVVAGATALLAGVPMMDRDGGTQVLGLVNGGIGLASIAVSVRNVIQPHDARTASAPSAASRLSLVVAPAGTAAKPATMVSLRVGL